MTTEPIDVTADWRWEGNIVDKIVEYLEATGWTVVARADARKREHGPDIDARQVGHALLVEVKGYPSEVYRDPRRAGERKRTNPKLQARHWFAQALHTAIEMADGASGLATAIGLPDMEAYGDLVRGCERSLNALGIGVFFVTEDGSVIEYIAHRPRYEAFDAIEGHNDPSSQSGSRCPSPSGSR